MAGKNAGNSHSYTGGNYYAGSRRLCRIFCYGYGSYGGVYSFVLGVEILQPQFTIQKQNLAKGCQTTLLLESVAGNPVVYQTRDTSIVSIVSYNQAGVVVKAKKVGSTTVVAQVVAFRPNV